MSNTLGILCGGISPIPNPSKIKNPKSPPGRQGQFARNRGTEIRRKRVIGGGLGGKWGVIKGHLGPRKQEKGHFFVRGRAGWWAERDFRAKSGHYARTSPRPENHPGGNAARATDEKLHHTSARATQASPLQLCRPDEQTTVDRRAPYLASSCGRRVNACRGLRTSKVEMSLAEAPAWRSAGTNRVNRAS